jgi:hypothetical protein
MKAKNKSKRVARGSLRGRVLRAVGVFVKHYRQDPPGGDAFYRNGDRVNAALWKVIKSYEEMVAKTRV